MREQVGLDFGTTNSAIARAGDGELRLAEFESAAGPTPAFRSILYFECDEDRPGLGPLARAGPAAIERYLETAGEGRLIQSLKSFLASPLFEATDVFGRPYPLEDLIGDLLSALREAAERVLGDLGSRVVVGRPVRFAGARQPSDEWLALERLRSALTRAGFDEVTFEYEPVAAAYHYARRLREPEFVLIGDFGGGTSDFSLLRLRPGEDASRHEILGTSGVGLAGDAFDARLVRNAVSPHLGRGSRYRNPFGQVLPVPHWLYRNVERWHHLSFLRSPKTLSLLSELEQEALEPEKIARLRHLVHEDRGFYVYQAVESAKRALSESDCTRVRYADGPIELDRAVERADFETWIEDELVAIADCVDELLRDTEVTEDRVDRVFLTGGSAFVPAVRRLFVARFGAERLRGGEELSSVASGLALAGTARAP